MFSKLYVVLNVAAPRKIPVLEMSHLGFTPPQPQQITQGPAAENAKLIERKQRLLTELAALETGIDIFDFLDPARDQLQTSVTDVSCSVELLSVSGKQHKPGINVREASAALAAIITDIGESPSRVQFEIPRPPPKSSGIANHARVFFAQLKQLKDARAGVLTAFSVIPVTKGTEQAPAQSDQPQDDDTPSSKCVHPFFPDVKGLGPLLGHMKEQLGEFPNFVRKQPSEEECRELRLAADPDCLKKHLLEICGSSSDDEFDPDSPLEPEQRTQSPYPHGVQKPV